MTMNLSDEDRRAIDLLFDQQRTIVGGGNGMNADGLVGGFSPHAPAVSQERIAGVERVLSLLDMLPLEEPPPGLVERTLARIEGSMDPADRPPLRHPTLDSTAHA